MRGLYAFVDAVQRLCLRPRRSFDRLRQRRPNRVEVGPEGAVVVIDSVVIDIPAGAISSGIAVINAALEDDLPAPFPQGLIPAGRTVVLTASGIDRFELPVRITVPFDAAVVGAQEWPVMIHWDEFFQMYYPVTSTDIDAQHHTITFSTVHFSKFGIGTTQSASILKAADSRFRTTQDGFFHPNFGSWFDPGGWCKGFAVYSTWYYVTKSDEEKIPQAETPLYFMYRNHPGNDSRDPICPECDPSTWLDDPTAREVANRSFPARSDVLYQSTTLSDEANLYTLLVHLSILRAPLVLAMVNDRSAIGHGVVAYRYEPPAAGFFSTAPEGRGRVFVYDSNICNDDGCPPATLDFGIDPADPTGPLKFFNYSEDLNLPKEERYTQFYFLGLSITRPSELEQVYQKAKTGWSAAESTFVSIRISSATDGKGNALDVSPEGNISGAELGAITINGNIGLEGSTTWGLPEVSAFENPGLVGC